MKSYITNGLLIYGEILYLRVSSYMTLQLLHSEFPYTVYEENFILFLSVYHLPFVPLFLHSFSLPTLLFFLSLPPSFPLTLPHFSLFPSAFPFVLPFPLPLPLTPSSPLFPFLLDSSLYPLYSFPFSPALPRAGGGLGLDPG